MAVIDGKWLSKEGLTYFWSKIKAIFTKQTETNVIANLGAKNLLNNKLLYTASGTGVTIVSNGDGTYSLSGTATVTATYLYTSIADFSSLYGIETGKSYTITAGSNKVLIRIDYSTNGTSWDNGEDGQPLVSNIAGEATFMVPASTIGLYIRFRSTASHGSLNGVILKPMIRHAEITDGTFQPYAPTNRELYETRFASKTILPNNVDLNDIKAGGIYNGVNSTGNSAVHMPVATGSFNFVLTVIEANEFIIQIFKQLNSAGDPNLYIRRFYIYNSDWDSWYQFTGTQV